MSDTDTTTPVADLDLDSDESGPKALREALKSTKAENAKLKAQLMNDAWEKVGLNPEEGLGLAIADRYDGEPTAEALAEFAAKYGHVVPEPQTPADTINNAQGALDQAAASAGSVPVSTNLDDLAKAEAEGDYATAMAIKNRLLLDKIG